MTKEEFLEEAFKGGPGLSGYVYDAEVYCVDCAKKIMQELVNAWEHLPDELPTDSEEFPVPVFFGESESPEYCADCQEFLYGDDPEYGLEGDEEEEIE